MIGGVERVTRSTEETEGLGAALAPALRTGDVLALCGPLGAGKTRFVAGLARGLACKARVRSPTFALLHEYHGRILLAHLDFYRLEGGEAEGLGLEEYAERAALVVEWGEKLAASWLWVALRLDFAPGADPRERRIAARAEGERGRALLAAWSALAVAPWPRSGA